MKKIFVFIAIIHFSVLAPVQAQVFKSGDRVCFVGNSITNNGEFHHNILLFQITRFPQQEVSFFNCGISGDVTSGMLNRMDSDILSHHPTHVIIMSGMNDVRRSLYGVRPTANTDTLKLRANAIEAYSKNLDKMVNLLLAKDIQIVLQKPTIYDQTVALPANNNFGVNDALKICADYVGATSEEYKLPVVDYWSIMDSINQQMQLSDPTATLTGKDRVHPGATGHFVMTYQFLKTLRFPEYVSKIIIDRNAIQKDKGSENCTVTAF